MDKRVGVDVGKRVGVEAGKPKAYLSPMVAEDRGRLVQRIVNKHLLPVLSRKGRDYTEYNKQSASVNSNFGAIADMLSDDNVGKYQVWAIFFLKHIQSILSWVATGKVESEGIEGRLTDAINYLFILWSMLIEDGVIGDIEE